MGAEHFDTTIPNPDPNLAFNMAVEAALWDYGHAGYTGTIAEKTSFVTFTPPEGHSADEAIAALEAFGNVAAPSWIPSNIVEAYDDKWGPAVAVPYAGGWRFIGWASS